MIDEKALLRELEGNYVRCGKDQAVPLEFIRHLIAQCKPRESDRNYIIHIVKRLGFEPNKNNIKLGKSIIEYLMDIKCIEV